MGLEVATYISDLVVTNPAGGDLKSTGDDHMRLIKSTLKNTFPNVTGAVTATHTRINQLAAALSTFSAVCTGMSLPLSTVTTVKYDTELFDIGSGYDPSTGIYTVPVTGYYMCTSGTFIINNTLSSGIINALYFSKNNATSGNGSRFDFNITTSRGDTVAPSSNQFLTNGTALIQATAGDTIRVKADVGAGANLTVSASPASYFSCYQVG